MAPQCRVKEWGGGFFSPQTLIALLGFCAFFVNAGAYWTYIEVMGHAAGIGQHTVAYSVAAGVSAGALGGVLAWVLGDRFGRLWPVCISGVLTIVAAFLVRGSFGVVEFVVSGLLYFFAWNYSLAYQLAIVTH